MASTKAESDYAFVMVSMQALLLGSSAHGCLRGNHSCAFALVWHEGLHTHVKVACGGHLTMAVTLPLI